MAEILLRKTADGRQSKKGHERTDKRGRCVKIENENKAGGKSLKTLLFFAVVALGILWGLSFLGINIALENMVTPQLLAVRWTISAALFLILIFAGKIKINFEWKYFRLALLSSFFEPCIYSAFEAEGINRTSTSEGSILISTIPSVSLLIGVLFLHKKCNWKIVGCILLALSGVTICTVFSPGFSISGKLQGYLILMVAVVAGSIYGYMSNRAGRHYSALELTAMMSVVASIFFNILNLLMGYGFSAYRLCFSDGRSAAAVLFLGIGCSFICYTMFNFVLAKIENTALATNITSSVVTSVGVASGVLIAGDPCGPYTLIGLALALCGVWLSSKQV